MHFDEWKMIDEDLYYDWKLVRKVSAQHNCVVLRGIS